MTKIRKNCLITEPLKIFENDQEIQDLGKRHIKQYQFKIKNKIVKINYQ